jgi:LysM repeat protein
MNQTYVVKSGDTLYGISNQFGVSVRDILNLNDVDVNNLQIGTVLIIPNVAGTNPDNTFVYTVKKGDSLYGVARMYNTTVDKIKELNNLKSNTLSIGQELVIPETYDEEDSNLINYMTYTVKKGDSLYSIAKANNITVDTIIQDNSLKSNLLSIGQVLKIRIPNGMSSDETAVLECIGPDYTPPEDTNYTVYTVKKGDNLYSIANKYNTSVTAIKNLNNLSSNNLSINQVLKIPVVSSTTTTNYVVKSGDSLYSIARKYNTTVDAIKSKNNLTSNLLTIGQTLKI